MKRALLAVNGVDRSGSLLSVVKTMEPETVILVHVRTIRKPARSSDRKDALDRETENLMSFYRKELEDGSPVKVAVQVREGDPGREILRAAREEDADVIVLGSSGTSRFRRLSAGSVATEVERNALVPVLVSKTGGSKKTLFYNWRGEVYASQ